MIGSWIGSVVAIAHRAGLLMIQIVPFVLLGAWVAAVLHRTRFGSGFRRMKTMPVIPLTIVSAIMGALSPFCTFGTVPVVIRLLNEGFPVSAGMAFLAASSMVNPQMLLLQASTVGPFLSAVQGLAGVAIGVAAGAVILILERREIRLINPGVSTVKADADEQRPVGKLFLGQLNHLLIYVTVGILLAAILAEVGSAMIPSETLRATGILAPLIGAAASVPLYVCGGSSMPILGTLLAQGISPGLILAFMIAGPATRIQALAAVKSLLDRRALGGYILLVLVGATVIGLGLNLFLSGKTNCYGLQ